MNEKNIAITFTHPKYAGQAACLAEKLKLHYINIHSPFCNIEFLLIYQNGYLCLAATSEKLGNPIYVDFLCGKEGYRLKHLQHELILKAVGCKKKFRPRILDTTAGLANDSFILAANGCEVLMLEKAPILAALIDDGLQRFFASIPHTPLKINLQCMDAKFYLQQQTEKLFDVIYLDPMFPTRKKTALVKKEMRILQKLLDSEEDMMELFTLALANAKKRVVVKRPLYDDNAMGSVKRPKPNMQYKARNIRFEVYLV